MSDYKYKRPRGDVYRVSMREWNKVFGNRGSSLFMYVEVYVDNDLIISRYFCNTLAKVYVTLLYPVLVVCEGYKDAGETLRRYLFQKRLGSFSSDFTYRRHEEAWSKIEKLVGKEL